MNRLRWPLLAALACLAYYSLFVSFTDRVTFSNHEVEPATSGTTTVNCEPILHGGNDPNAYAGTVLDDARCNRPAAIRRVAVAGSAVGGVLLVVLGHRRRLGHATRAE